MPDPFIVRLFRIVGFMEVLQQIPLDVTVVPPSATTLPPQIADVVVIDVTAIVVTVGMVCVLNDITDPYAVPIALVAYALTKYVVPGDKAVIEEINAPVPEPFNVRVLAIVGVPVVFQQIPLVVTGEPPSLITLPPQVADVFVIEVNEFVVTDPIFCVVKDTSPPYDVPTALVAYALT